MQHLATVILEPFLIVPLAMIRRRIPAFGWNVSAIPSPNSHTVTSETLQARRSPPLLCRMRQHRQLT